MDCSILGSTLGLKALQAIVVLPSTLKPELSTLNPESDPSHPALGSN